MWSAPEVISETEQTFDGRRYWRNAGGYFRRSRRFLHRDVWASIHGPIAPGLQIHHVDGNKANNHPSNLVALTPKGHAAEHWTPEAAEASATRIRGLSHLSRPWHQSPEGIAWHRANGHRSIRQRLANPVEKQCECCGATFATIWPNKTRFCHRNCKQRQRRIEQGERVRAYDRSRKRNRVTPTT